MCKYQLYTDALRCKVVCSKNTIIKDYNLRVGLTLLKKKDFVKKHELRYLLPRYHTPSIHVSMCYENMLERALAVDARNAVYIEMTETRLPPTVRSRDSQKDRDDD